MCDYSILVIVVTYNAMPWAKRCFDSLVSSTIPLDIFVVDNGSSDGSQQFICETYPDVIFHQSESNLGFGRANNIGMEYAIEHRYDYVYLLNQDAWVLKDTIENIIKCHIRNPEYGILSPMQLSAEKNEFDINFRNHTCNRLFLLTEDLYFGHPKMIYTAESVMAAHWLVSVDCLKRVGGFSPTFNQYGEDDNYIDRVHFHKMKVGIVPSAKAIHDRKYREQTREQFLFHHFYKYYLVLFSQPRKVFILEWIKMMFSNTLSAFKYKSFKLIRYTLQLIMESHQIRMNRLRSMNNGAFLS